MRRNPNAGIELKIYNKITSLNHRVKVHKTNSMLKKDAVIKYLNELHEKNVLVPIDKAANNIAITWKKYYITFIWKEIGNETKCNEIK